MLGAVTRAAADVSPRVATAGYRASLEQLMSGLVRWAPQMSTPDIGRQLAGWLDEPEASWVANRVPGGGDRVVEQALEEYANFTPSEASNAGDPVSLMRIVLLQQIDVAWWSHIPGFADDRAISLPIGSR